jgi:hypothetical protein
MEIGTVLGGSGVICIVPWSAASAARAAWAAMLALGVSPLAKQGLDVGRCELEWPQ